ncbi:MAG: hypothetical protein NTV94_18080 [Planctomycetota bacterium]|nr:hypothetical protein [Planctomycetota bacterium]
MKNSTRAYWSTVLDDFARSRLGVRDFCARRGISVNAFYLRRRQLARTSTPRPSAAGTFIEARIVPDGPAPQIIIELPSRERVLVPREACETFGITVLRAIARASAGGGVGGAA